MSRKKILITHDASKKPLSPLQLIIGLLFLLALYFSVTYGFRFDYFSASFMFIIILVLFFHFFVLN